MIKDTRSANEKITPNARELEVLKEHFPSCFNGDGALDMVRFTEYVRNKVNLSDEGYELKFLGKSYAKLLSSLDTEVVIEPDLKHNMQPENINSQNVYISGDNLDGLKHMLKSYSGEIKCIYIDPPYNTGKDDFSYNDRFDFSLNDLMNRLSMDEEQARRVLNMTRRGSASHSAWLTFMYPRLLHARDLLKDEGMIFISIDENEHSNLQLLCNEIFGDENFAGEIIWKNSSKNDQDYISVQHEYILCYVKNKLKNPGQWREEKEGIKEIFKAFDGFHAKFGNDWAAIHKAALEWYKQFPESDPIYSSRHYSWMDEKGVYFPSDISGPNYGQYRYDVIHPVTGKICKEPASGWRYPKETMLDRISQNLVHFGEDETTIPNNKTYLKDTITQGLTSIKYKDGRVASKQLAALMGTNCFTNPKDTSILTTLIKAVGIEDGDIILDFFSGSGSTAEAVMNLMCSGIHARFFLIQLREDLDDSLARATGSGKQVLKNAIALCDTLHVEHTVDQIGIERIKRVAAALQKDASFTDADYGFKHYTLRESDRTVLDKLETFDDSKFITDRTIYDIFGPETIVTTWLIHDGYGFSNHSEPVDLAGYTAYWCDNHLYLIEPEMTETSIEALIEKYNSNVSFNPNNIVVFGYSFNFVNLENLKTNIKILKDSEKNLKINLDIRY